ncbi:MAG: hypothetical protein ABIS67_06710 [Candidatus Eisenbacteria bacterium]
MVRSEGLTHRLDGPFRRFPLGAREVGRVAMTLEPRVLNGGIDGAGLAEPAWLSLHRIASFGAWPLPFRGRCLGVLAVFSARLLKEGAVQAVAATTRLAGAALGASLGADSALLQAGGAPRMASETMADVQRAAILGALECTGGKVSGPGGAAEMLGMKSTTLESRMRRLGVRKPARMRLR